MIMEEYKNIILSTTPNIARYSSNLIRKGLALANDINQSSIYYCEQTNQLLEEAKYLYGLEVYREALTCSEKIIKINQSCAEAWWYKARSLWKEAWTKEKPKDALKAVNRAIILKHDFIEALLTKSAILMDLGEYSEVIIIAKEVIKIKPNEYRALYNQGLAFKILGRIHEADLAFNKALKIKFDSCNVFQQIKDKIENSNLNTEKITEVIDINVKDLGVVSSSVAINSKMIACTGNLCPKDFFECIDMLTVFNFDTNEFVYFHCTGHSEQVVFSPNEQLLAQAIEDNPVRVYNAQTGKLIRTLDCNNISISQNEKGIAFSHNGEILASSDYDGHIFLWNCKNGELLKTLSTPFNTEFKKYDDIYFSLDNKTLIAKDNYGIIDSWQL